MGFRLYRRVRIAPGIRLNLGTRGASMSFGHRGCWYTTGAHGRRTATLGFPGTGLRYTTSSSGSSRPVPPPAPSALRSLFVLAVVVILLSVAVAAVVGSS